MKAILKNTKKMILTSALLLMITAGAQAQLNWKGEITLTDGQNVTQNVTLTGDMTVNVPTGATATISGNIVGNYQLTKGQGGTLILTNDNPNLKGFLLILSGVLQVGNGTSGGIWNVSKVHVSFYDVLRFMPGSDMDFSRLIEGEGNVEYKGANGKLLYLTANNTYTGTTTVLEGGALCIGNNTTTGSIAGDIVIDKTSGWVDFRRSDNYTYSGVISGAGNISKYNANKLTLTGVNTYTGGTHIGDGI
ncbi:MAG: hypothetical protein LBD23_01890, partial [Oscillospiraceae bacterium]|nr:hypothetical protein [Oscillospiraceae bacterium]